MKQKTFGSRCVTARPFFLFFYVFLRIKTKPKKNMNKTKTIADNCVKLLRVQLMISAYTTQHNNTPEHWKNL